MSDDTTIPPEVLEQARGAVENMPRAEGLSAPPVETPEFDASMVEGAVPWNDTAGMTDLREARREAAIEYRDMESEAPEPEKAMTIDDMPDEELARTLDAGLAVRETIGAETLAPEAASQDDAATPQPAAPDAGIDADTPTSPEPPDPDMDR